MCDESSSSPNSEFYDEEFDGISAEMGGGNSRGTAAVNDSYSVGFGIPLDVDEISARASDEFDAAGAEKTRAISAVELLPYSSHSPTLDPFAREIDSGSTFQASPGIFGASTSFPPPTHEEIQVAPPLPPFVKPARTSFRCAQALPALRAALEAAFAATSVTFSPAEDTAESDPHPCAYACSSVCLLSMVTFDVRIFALPAATNAAPRHLVEVRHLGGCRYAFKAAAASLNRELGAAFKAKDGCCEHPVTRPPPLSSEDHIALPTLERPNSSNCNSRAQMAMGKVVNNGLPSCSQCGGHAEDAKGEEGGMDEEEAETCEHLLKLLGDDVPLSSQVQGVRAAGALAAHLAAAMDSCELHGACGFDHGCCRPTLFDDEGAWARLALRITVLASSPEQSGRPSDETLRASAMAAVANLTALRTACGKWLDAAVAAVAEGTGDDCGHVRREALRAAAALVEREGGEYAAKLVRAGAVPAMEIEANGGDGESCPDDAAQRYAEAALLACRS